MYDLPYHKEGDPDKIKEFISRYPFAMLTGCGSDQMPVATQIPVFIEEKQGASVLRGHIMKNTDHHQAFLQNNNVLLVFTGKSTYVSGSWYSNPHTASTWNYMSVHVKGRMRFVREQELEEILRQTSLHYENRNPDSPTVYDNLPRELKHRVLGAIAGFEIEILEINTVFKLSQDRDRESYLNIIKNLKDRDHDAQVIASEMEKRYHGLFINPA